MAARTADQVQQYADGIVVGSGGWAQHSVTITPADVRNLSRPISVSFWCRDTKRWLQEIIEQPELRGHFVAVAGAKWRGRGAARRRVFDGPHTADVWIKLQQLLRGRLPAAQQSKAAIAALQLYSDKTLLTMKGLQAHPIR